jgi:rare lipoprotein A
VIARRLGPKTTLCLLALACALLALPAIARARDPLAFPPSRSGGGGLGSIAGPTATPSAAVSATGDGVTLTTTSAATLRGRLLFSGTAPGAAGHTLEIERQGPSTDFVWTPTVTATVLASGSFQTVWRTNQSGRFAVRAIVVSGLAALAVAPPTLTVTVYPTSRATIYGPGFYGRQTACGATLTRATVGVANRSLPCGTAVSILYHGRSLVVPVVDRGPYANGADWDLTAATAQALGIDGTERIGTIALTTPAATAGGLTGRG